MFSSALAHIAKALACAPVIVLALAVADSSPPRPSKARMDSIASTFEARPPSELEAARAGFIGRYEKQGGSFAVDIQQGKQSVDLKITGVSAHGSRPEEGGNPLPRLALFLRDSALTLADNHYANVIRCLNELYGTDYLGEIMGVSYNDDFMGPLTMSPTLVRKKGDRLAQSETFRTLASSRF